MTTSDISARRFRNALGEYASGITIVTALSDGAPVGFTCQSFYSVSLEPKLVSFCVSATSQSWPIVRGCDRFAINFLAAHQAFVSQAMASKTGDRWSNVEWIRTPLGNPRIKDAVLCLECTLHAEHVAGDHTIVIAEVQDLSESAGLDPLIFFKGQYRRLAAMAEG